MIILDTNVLSELMRPAPSRQVIVWLADHAASQFAVTTITEAEIFYGLELLPSGKRRDRLLAAAEAMFAEDFQGAVLAFDSEAARAFSRIASDRRSCGRPISQPDAQIAAIARVHKACLATRNVDDFDGCGIEVHNPWAVR